MKVVVLGATGMIGQQFVRILADHPTFELTHLYASDRSAGQTMEQMWQLPGFDCPNSVKDMVIEDLAGIEQQYDDFSIAFSGLPKSIANTLEKQLRQEGKKVFSNAGSHRMDQDVPILIPEINGDHLELVKIQQENYGTDGYIITNSNCSAAGAAVYLAEVNQIQTIETAVVTTYQALSGAGIGGVAALDILGNVIPYIGNEEPKIIEETRKMLGTLQDGSIVDHPMDVVANAARVHVSDGHLEAITTFFNKSPAPEFATQLAAVQSPLDVSNYHIAPRQHLHTFTLPDRPQPRLDVFRSDDNPASTGMTVHAGRIRPASDNISAYVLVHNTIRGGAGGSVLNAEYAIQQGYL